MLNSTTVFLGIDIAIKGGTIHLRLERRAGFSTPLPQRLSIIACDMLEDELAYVLAKDSELAQLILVENNEHFGLQRKLKSRGC